MNDVSNDKDLTPETWKRIGVLFHSVIKLPPAERVTFLKESCAGDPVLQERVMALVEADEDSNVSFSYPLISFTPIGEQVSHYEIQSKLGEGGMGEVYLARDITLDRLVALKILRPNLVNDEDRLRRFVIEAKAASAVKHSNVAHIYEIGEANGIRFIAMEYIEGETFAKVIVRARYSAEEVVRAGIEIARALEAAHGRGIIHRDLKPANIMIMPDGQLKLLDFGIAKISAVDPATGDMESIPTQTQAGLVLGTVPYCSPEQLLGKPIDHRTDFFSLGVVLYQLATQQLPFQGITTIEIADSILHSDCPAPDQFNSSIPWPLSNLIMKLLSKNPEDRYQNASEIISDLEAVQRLKGIRKRLAMQPLARFLQPIAVFPTLFTLILVVIGWQFNETLKNSATKIPDKLPARTVTGDSRNQSAGTYQVSPSVFEAYSRGLKYSEGDLTSKNILYTVKLFQRAVDLDPKFAQGWTELSKAYSLSYFFYRDPEHRVRAKAAADRAFEIQPGMPEAHLALGYYYYRLLAYDLALEEFRIAEKSIPENKSVLTGQAVIYRRQGKFEEGLAKFQRLFEINPQNANVACDIGATYTLMRKFPEAQRYFDLCISLAPDQELGYSESGYNRVRWKGDTKGAREIFDKAPLKGDVILSKLFLVELYDRNYPAALEVLSDPNSTSSNESIRAGVVYRLMNHPEKAHASFETARIELEKNLREQPENPGLHSHLGIAYAGLGQKEDAIREGKRSVELFPVSKDAVWGPDAIESLIYIYILLDEHNAALDQIEYLLSIPGTLTVAELRIDPRFDTLRPLPRFHKLLTQEVD